jgi:hypothetical protein
MVDNNDKIWKKFLRNHWKLCVLFIVVAAIAIIGAIYVFLWFVGDAQLTGLIPSSLGLWSMGYLVTFLLNLIFWEIIYIGIPVIIVLGIIYYLGWKKIPDDERAEYRRGHLFGGRNHRSESGEGISFFIFIVFIIKVWLDGKWSVAFAKWEFDYLVYSWLWALVWVLVIIGIPILIGGSWWLRNEMKKEP